MFQSSIPADAQKIVVEAVQSWDQVNDLYIGCSGNFPIERALSPVGRFRLHSNDVGLLSSALGAVFAGQPFQMQMTDTGRRTVPFVEETIGTPVDIAATLMVLANLLPAISKKGELKRNNPYYMRIYRGHEQQWKQLHEKTVDSLLKNPTKITSYTAQNLDDWLPTLPKDSGLISYPPFWQNSTEDLEAPFGQMFEWDRPTRKPYDAPRVARIVESLLQHSYWLVGTLKPVEELEGYLHGTTQTTNRGTPVYLYASMGPRRIVVPHQKLEPVATHRLTPGLEIGNQLEIKVLSTRQFDSLRSQYLNAAIAPGAPSLAIAVLVDGYLVGSFALSSSPSPAQAAYVDRMYLLSDFAVAPTDYPRLSKLVLCALLSQEVRILAERLVGRRIRKFYTTAFSNKPSSMKYRGLFTITNRWEREPDGPDGQYGFYNQRYATNYLGEAGQWPLSEVLPRWKQKWAVRKAGSAAEE